MSDIAVSVSGVSKMYRLFRSRRHEVMSLLGLPVSARSYDEFWALRDINLQVPAGGKIGIIGHNGAGKSTLLKIIGGQVAPTEGKVRVRGRVQALMELGTGFHPEFSGRENIYSALSYQGVTGNAAELRYDEILDFSELEDFIDNPVKTYSAGMYARLAFSVATAIEPEILIIDEVLGAGDAYFAAKCVDRMKVLTDGGATVLFVSHDMASVQRLCDQAIWINRGRIASVGDTMQVAKLYMKDVRDRQEKRIRAANMRLRLGEKEAAVDVSDLVDIVVHFIEEGWRKPVGSLPIAAVELRAGETLGTVEVGHAADNDASAQHHVITQRGYIEWSEPEVVAHRRCRRFTSAGGEYRHAALKFSVDTVLLKHSSAPVELAVTYFDAESPPVHVEIFDGARYNRLGTLVPGGSKEWRVSALPVPIERLLPDKSTEFTAGRREDAQTPDQDAAIDIIGSGRANIRGISFEDEGGTKRHVFEPGEPMRILLDYSVAESLEELVIALAVYTADGVTVYQDVVRPEPVSFAPGDYRYSWLFSPAPFGVRDYVVSAALYRHFDFLSGPDEKSAYSLWDRRARFSVSQRQSSAVDMGILVFRPQHILSRV